MGKIVQTAGRNTLGEFAPEFAHFNDDVLFGENWNNQDIDVKTRSIITVVTLMLIPFPCLMTECLLFSCTCIILASSSTSTSQKCHTKYSRKYTPPFFHKSTPLSLS